MAEPAVLAEQEMDQSTPELDPVRGELVIHERNQLLSLASELPLHYPLRL